MVVFETQCQRGAWQNVSKPNTCAWCGEALPSTAGHDARLCPECQHTYEVEKQCSLHPAGPREPYQD